MTYELLALFIFMAFPLSLIRNLKITNVLLLGGGFAVALIAVFALIDYRVGSTEFLFSNWLRFDDASRLFAALAAIVFFGVCLYAWNRGRQSSEASSQLLAFAPRAFLFFFLSLVSIFSNHLALTIMALEASTLVVVPLIFLGRSELSIQAAWKYLLFSCVGLGLSTFGILLLGGFSFLENHQVAQSITIFSDSIGPVLSNSVDNLRLLGLSLFVLGISVKLGLAPMYAWLPETYDMAPPSVTVLLSSLQFNCVALMTFRVLFAAHASENTFMQYEFLTIGITSIFISSIQIILTTNYKKLIAFASINHAGVIMIGLGLGGKATYGVLLYLLSNSLVKAVLFLTCGNIKATFRTKSIGEVQGLIKAMPLNGWMFMIGVFALLGFAPFGSFFGEILIMQGLISANHPILFIVFCALLTLVFLGTGRALFPMIWGQPKMDLKKRGDTLTNLLPNLLYSGILLSLGIYLPQTAGEFLRRVALSFGSLQ